MQAEVSLKGQKVYSAAGKHVGDISTVHNFMGVNVCVACKEHRCRFMVQAHRVTSHDLIAKWLRQGEFVGKDDHEASFHATAQIVPSQRRGRGRGRGVA